MYKMKKILIVDDEPDICLTLACVLEGYGFVIDTFDDPLLALQDFRKDLYDHLILDIKMKKMNGFELYDESIYSCIKWTKEESIYSNTDSKRRSGQNNK